jgi:hypothetical protein
MDLHPDPKTLRFCCCHVWRVPAALLAVASAFQAIGAASGRSQVDFRYSPPEWQTAICLPDDPNKTLVDKSGELLYHYGQGGREFATRISVEISPGSVWQRQELESPRVPIVRTFRRAGDLQVVEEAFALTEIRPPRDAGTGSRRLDSGTVLSNWANPPAAADPALKDIAVHFGGGLEFGIAVPVGGRCQVALVLCEGYWNQPGKRVQVLNVEGASPKRIDAVADLGKNRPGAFLFQARDLNGDGFIEVKVDADSTAGDQNTVLNALWVAPANSSLAPSAFVDGSAAKSGARRLDLRGAGAPAREDIVMIRVSNPGAAPAVVAPRLIIDTTLSLRFEPAANRALLNEQEEVSVSLAMKALETANTNRRVIQLASATIPAGEAFTFFVLHSSGLSSKPAPTTVDQALACRRRSVKYWEKAPLPFGRVTIPDPGVQALIDSSIRNIWQAREIKRGLPAFQVGPTCYRGLWIVDGAFLLESAALLGAGREARSGVAYELTYQQADGRIQVMKDFSKENGIVLWTCVRHAQLTQDKPWLEGLWPRLERVAEHIHLLRQQTLTNHSTLDDGLLPAGFPDGGIGGLMDEYTNPYWNLAGLRAFIQAAQWLGKSDSAVRWQAEYDDFLAAYRRAAARDMKKDSSGNSYVPTRMDGLDLPQRGQWAFCQAIYPGQVFAKEDPLVASTLAMLEATEREGMVYGTGWDATGIWNYFASFYGHAWLWQGNGAKAAQVLVAFANHAAPTLVWREEQSLKGEPFKKVGDMPHNWASAEFIRLAVHLIALDRGEELHLLEGMPREWLGAGMVTKLEGVATPFGPLYLKVEVDRAGKNATLDLRPLAANCRAVVLHLPGGTAERLEAHKGARVSFPVR